MGSIVDKMKNNIKSSGGSRKKILYVGDGQKRRVRFLQELDQGLVLTFHDSFTLGVNALCLDDTFGQPCKHCGNDALRTREMFGFLIFDYEDSEIKVFLYAANNFSPLPQIIVFADTYGTVTDRDFVIHRNGKEKKTSYSVVPLDPAKMRKQPKKPSKSAVLKIIAKAFPQGDDDTDDYDDAVEQVEDEEVWDDDEYANKSPKELYKLCKEKDLDPDQKQPKEYYIELLKSDSVDDEDWDNEDDEDWDEDGDSNDETIPDVDEW